MTKTMQESSRPPGTVIVQNSRAIIFRRLFTPESSFDVSPEKKAIKRPFQWRWMKGEWMNEWMNPDVVTREAFCIVFALVIKWS